MRQVVNFSGGRTSAFMAYLLKERLSDPLFVFLDTASEHPKTYEFIKRVNAEWGLNLVCLRGRYAGPLGQGLTVEEVPVDELKCDFSVFAELMAKYGTPTVNAGWCSSRMKKEVHDKYFKGVEKETWLGIRADEPRRLGDKPGIRYLAELSDFGKEDVLDWWYEQPFDLGLPEHLGNCVFCVKKNPRKIARCISDEPELACAFMGAVACASPRPDLGRVAPKEVMYRGRNSLLSLAVLNVENVPTRHFEGGCGSESCEGLDL